MLYLIAYDITNAKRLRKVARICEDFGVRLERSVFECYLGMSDFSKMWKKLEEVVADSCGDQVVAYPIGKVHEDDIRVLGVERMHWHRNTMVF